MLYNRIYACLFPHTLGLRFGNVLWMVGASAIVFTDIHSGAAIRNSHQEVFFGLKINVGICSNV